QLPNINAKILYVCGWPPNLVENEVMRQHFSCMLYQQAQYVVFLGRQLDFLIVEFHNPAHKINREAVALEKWFFTLLLQPVTQSNAQTCGKFFHAKWFGDVIVGPFLKRTDDPGLVRTT